MTAAASGPQPPARSEQATREAEIRARLEAATPIHTRPVAAHLAALDLLNHAPEDIAYLLERVEKLEGAADDVVNAWNTPDDEGLLRAAIEDLLTVLRTPAIEAAQ